MVSKISPQQWFKQRQLQAVQPEYYNNTPAQPMQLSAQQQQLNNSMLLLAILMVLVLIAVILGIGLGVVIGKKRD